MTLVWLSLSAVLAGAMNAIAGGGTLLTFPALLSVVGPRAANVTSTVALLPGSVASAWGYRAELAGCRRWLWILTPPSVIGGAIGSCLLVGMREEVFRGVVPWLVLLAAVLFLIQPRVVGWVRSHAPSGPPTGRTLAAVVAMQFLIGVYGGYFGAGIGILMLSSLGFLGLSGIHQMNAVKSFLAFCMNGVSALIFAFVGEVHWPFAGLMAASAMVGGYAGARLALRLRPAAVRWIVIVIGFGLSAYFFWRQYAA